MKNVSIFYLFILFASALLPVFSNPLPCNAGETCLDIVERNDAELEALKQSALATIKYIKTHDVSRKAVLFYSGSTKVTGKPKPVSAYQKIADFKKKVHDVQTLGDIVKEAKQNSGDWKDPEWHAVSEALAQQVHNPVFVLLGKDVSPKSVYKIGVASSHKKRARQETSRYLRGTGRWEYCEEEII